MVGKRTVCDLDFYYEHGAHEDKHDGQPAVQALCMDMGHKNNKRWSHKHYNRKTKDFSSA